MFGLFVKEVSFYKKYSKNGKITFTNLLKNMADLLT